MRDPYAPFDEFVRPAWKAKELWRIIAMIILFEIIFALTPSVFALLLPTQTMVDEFYDGVTTFGTLAQFAAFGVSAAGLVVLLRLLHGRGFWSLIGPQTATKTDLIRVATQVAFVLLVIELLPPWSLWNLQAEMRPLGSWAAFLPFALVTLLIQVGTEEMFFRGYLQQQFACVSSSKWAWMIVPSVMFGGLHYFNGNGTGDGLVWAIWATSLGIACADLTARTGNLGAAIGLHLANNLFALMLVAIDGWPSSGLALFLLPHEDPQAYAYGVAELLNPWMMLYLLTMLLTTYVMWLAARIALKR